MAASPRASRPPPPLPPLLTLLRLRTPRPTPRPAPLPSPATSRAPEPLTGHEASAGELRRGQELLQRTLLHRRAPLRAALAHHLAGVQLPRQTPPLPRESRLSPTPPRTPVRTHDAAPRRSEPRCRCRERPNPEPRFLPMRPNGTGSAAAPLPAPRPQRSAAPRRLGAAFRALRFRATSHLRRGARRL